MPNSAKEQLLSALKSLEEARQSSPAASRRLFTRYEVRGDAEMNSPDRKHVSSHPSVVMLRDLSRGGIGFVADSPVDTSSIWRIQFQQNGYDIADMNVVVRFCKSIAKDVHLCGAQICVPSGMMCLLGVDPARMRSDASDDGAADFLEPHEV